VEKWHGVLMWAIVLKGSHMVALGTLASLRMLQRQNQMRYLGWKRAHHKYTNIYGWSNTLN